MLKLLLHICCGPCACYPLEVLAAEKTAVTGFFFNPNIHPYQEFQRRLTALAELADGVGLAVEYERNYGLREYLRQVVFHEDERCPICYRMRLTAAAQRAAALGMDAFSTTLLYSRYQRHELIREIGEEAGRRAGVSFLYRDFRVGWQDGITRSKELGLYRQPYCGCIYSEQDRYQK